MLAWEYLHPQANEYHIGYIGQGLSEGNPLSAAKQIDQLYRFGGWSPSMSVQLRMKHVGNNVLKFPGDPPQYPIARAKLRDETICVYNSEFWAIFQPDGSFEISRLD